jgi:hypothetical protein
MQPTEFLPAPSLIADTFESLTNSNVTPCTLKTHDIILFSHFTSLEGQTADFSTDLVKLGTQIQSTVDDFRVNQPQTKVFYVHSREPYGTTTFYIITALPVEQINAFLMAFLPRQS